MRKIKVQVQMSLDGFVGGPNGELDWIWVSKPGLDALQRVMELADTCDTILLGRKMTPGFIDHWENMLDNDPGNNSHALARQMVTMRKIVFSKTLKEMKGRNLEVENGDLATKLAELKRRPGKDIIVYGGATFLRSIIGQHLADEFYIFRKPVAIGKGLSIFDERTILQLEDVTTYKDGTILGKYVPARN